jgi:hypothetical protein
MDLLQQDSTPNSLGKAVVAALTTMAMAWPFAMVHPESYQMRQPYLSS